MPEFLALGTFDGVHLGHREIIKTTVREAIANGCKSRIIFFALPPKFYFSGEKENFLITLPKEREKLIESLRADFTESIIFDSFIAQTSAEEFFKHVLLEKYNAKGIAVGPDFTFGKNREGNKLFLENECKKNNIIFLKIPFLKYNEHKISSSLIRNYLFAGKITEANSCLGYNYFFSGTIKRGAGIGRQLGFPTANMSVKPLKIIPPGIFTAHAYVCNEKYNAVLSIGKRPTLNTLSGRLIPEVHILDFNKNIYEKEMRIELLDFIRGEKKFSSKDELVSQIQQDKQFAVDYFNNKNRVK